MRAAAVVRHRASSPKVLDRVLAETHARKFTVSQSVSQSAISRSRTALTPPTGSQSGSATPGANHKYRVLPPGSQMPEIMFVIK